VAQSGYDAGVNKSSWQFTGNAAAWFYFTTAADGYLSLR
jgi:hypothetical protein